MNTYAIVTQALRNMREPEANRSTLADALLDGINEGYMRIVAETQRPTEWSEAVTLDTDKGFDIADVNVIGGVVSRVDKVARHIDFSEDAGWHEMPALFFETVAPTRCVVPSAEAGATVYVRVLLAAPTLTMGVNAADTTASTIPSMLPAEFRPALAHYAAAHLWFTRAKYDKQAAAMERFYNAIDPLRPQKGSRAGMIQNVYQC